MIFWEKILWEGSSPYNGKVKVVESNGVRRLVADRYTQSRLLDETGKTNHYWDRFKENLPLLEKNPQVLILGMGGGTIGRILKTKYSSVKIKGVEIDPLIVELGKKFFYLDDKDIELLVEDAGSFISKDTDKYDAVCVDLFFKEKVSDLLHEENFLKKVRERLKENGVVIINKICRDSKEDNDFVLDMRKVFKEVKVSRERGNKYEQNVIFCGKA